MLVTDGGPNERCATASMQAELLNLILASKGVPKVIKTILTTDNENVHCFHIRPDCLRLSLLV